MFVSLLFLLLVNAKDNFMSFGLNTDFGVVKDTFRECSFHGSCYDILCDKFKNRSCVSYVVYTPLSNNLDCSVFLAYRRVNMIVFGFDKSHKIISPKKCGSIGGCFQTGCLLYNSNPNVTWIVFTGKCD